MILDDGFALYNLLRLLLDRKIRNCVKRELVQLAAHERGQASAHEKGGIFHIAFGPALFGLVGNFQGLAVDPGTVGFRIEKEYGAVRKPAVQSFLYR